VNRPQGQALSARGSFQGVGGSLVEGQFQSVFAATDRAMSREIDGADDPGSNRGRILGVDGPALGQDLDPNLGPRDLDDDVDPIEKRS
jgi:hypothetical protein